MAAGDLYKRVYDESLYPEAEKIPEKKPEKKAPASVKTEAPKKSEVKKRTAERAGTGSQERTGRTDSGTDRNHEGFSGILSG